MLKTSDFDYQLNERLIAQHPLPRRDASRLLSLDRTSGQIEHRSFADLVDLLDPGDILVANDSRVIPARLQGQKSETGGKVEILLLEKVNDRRWKALVGGKRINVGSKIVLVDKAGKVTEVLAEIAEELAGPLRLVAFSCAVESFIDRLGSMPLPPYIHEEQNDPQRYQTIYSRHEGSSAAPTAGLHFSSELLLALREKGILFETVTLHVGLDTFRPVHVDEVCDHKMHSEWATLSAESARRINDAKLMGGRIVAVGTTSVRVLETAALRSAGITGSLSGISHADSAGEVAQMCPWRPVMAFEGQTDLFIYPGYRPRVVDAMITNFHLPRSTLLMLVSAFVGRKQLLKAYQAAIKHSYRFYSFGDAMLIV